MIDMARRTLLIIFPCQSVSTQIQNHHLRYFQGIKKSKINRIHLFKINLNSHAFLPPLQVVMKFLAKYKISKGHKAYKKSKFLYNPFRLVTSFNPFTLFLVLTHFCHKPTIQKLIT